MAAWVLGESGRVGSSPTGGTSKINSPCSGLLVRAGWLAVGQATTADLPRQPVHPLGIGRAPGREAEIELREVAVQVLAADVMMRPVKRALELREEVLGLVGRYVAAHVLALGVVDRRVRQELADDALVVMRRVGVEVRRRRVDVLGQDTAQILAVDVRDRLGANLARRFISKVIASP